MKLYFAALQPAPPHDVDLSQLYCFDVSDRELTQRAPRVLGGVPLDQMVDPVMRIRWVLAGAVGGVCVAA
jgi:hypothetical protein